MSAMQKLREARVSYERAHFLCPGRVTMSPRTWSEIVNEFTGFLDLQDPRVCGMQIMVDRNIPDEVMHVE